MICSDKRRPLKEDFNTVEIGFHVLSGSIWGFRCLHDLRRHVKYGSSKDKFYVVDRIG
jgi:hypothetical protein